MRWSVPLIFLLLSSLTLAQATSSTPLGIIGTIKPPSKPIDVLISGNSIYVLTNGSLISYSINGQILRQEALPTFEIGRFCHDGVIISNSENKEPSDNMKNETLLSSGWIEMYSLSGEKLWKWDNTGETLSIECREDGIHLFLTEWRYLRHSNGTVGSLPFSYNIVLSYSGSQLKKEAIAEGGNDVFFEATASHEGYTARIYSTTEEENYGNEQFGMVAATINPFKLEVKGPSSWEVDYSEISLSSDKSTASLAWSPDGRYLAVSVYDTTKVYDNSGNEIKSFGGKTGKVIWDGSCLLNLGIGDHSGPRYSISYPYVAAIGFYGKWCPSTDDYMYSVEEDNAVIIAFRAHRLSDWKMTFNIVGGYSNSEVDRLAMSQVGLNNAEDPNEPVIVVGGPKVNKLPFKIQGVSFDRDAMTVNGTTYASEWTKEDYAIIYTWDTFVWVAGTHRFGTKAGLLWLKNNAGDQKWAIIKWEDLNENKMVELDEISLVASG